MASFRLYNIQLLPLDTSTTPEVGTTGYRNLFSLLREASKTARQEKTVIENSFKLPHDTYFTPFTIFPGEKFAEGTWVKFQKAETVVDLYTNESLFTAEKGNAAVSTTTPTGSALILNAEMAVPLLILALTIVIGLIQQLWPCVESLKAATWFALWLSLIFTVELISTLFGLGENSILKSLAPEESENPTP